MGICNLGLEGYGVDVLLYLLGALVATCGGLYGGYIGTTMMQPGLGIMVAASSVTTGLVIAAFGYVVVLLEQIRDALKAPDPQLASKPVADQASA